jgi:hypothetical protein
VTLRDMAAGIVVADCMTSSRRALRPRAVVTLVAASHRSNRAQAAAAHRCPLRSCLEQQEEMAMSSRLGLGIMVAVANLATGCMSTEPEVMATAEQGVMTLGYSWGTWSSSTVVLDASSTNQTCFLSGVFGDLQPNGYDPDGQGVGVRVISTGYYQIYVNTVARDLGAGVQCVNSVKGRTQEKGWHTGNPAPTWLASASDPWLRCFLTQVKGTPSGQATSGFVSSADFVKVWNDGFNWYVGGFQSTNGYVEAHAQCVDVNGDFGSWVWQAPDPGSRQDPLTNVAGASCPLTYVGGHFDIDDWGAGVYTSMETGTNHFFMNTNYGHTGWTTCVN